MRFSPQLATGLLVGQGDRGNGGTEVGACARGGRAVLPAVSGARAGRHGVHGELPVVRGPAGDDRARGVDRGCGQDSGQRCTTAKARPSGRRAAAEAAAGRTVSADLDTLQRATRPTAVAHPSPQAGAPSRPGEERTAAPGAESRGAEEAEAVERSRTEDPARVTVTAVGQPAARRPFKCEEDVGWAYR